MPTTWILIADGAPRPPAGAGPQVAHFKPTAEQEFFGSRAQSKEIAATSGAQLRQRRAWPAGRRRPGHGTAWSRAPTRSATPSTRSRAISRSIWRRRRTRTASIASSWSRRPRALGDLRGLLPKTVHEQDRGGDRQGSDQHPDARSRQAPRRASAALNAARVRSGRPGGAPTKRRRASQPEVRCGLGPLRGIGLALRAQPTRRPRSSTRDDRSRRAGAGASAQAGCVTRARSSAEQALDAAPLEHGGEFRALRDQEADALDDQVDDHRLARRARAGASRRAAAGWWAGPRATAPECRARRPGGSR